MKITLLFNLIVDQCGYMIDDLKEIIVEKKFPLSINYDHFYKININNIEKKYENISETCWENAYKSVKNNECDAFHDTFD